MDPEDDPVVSSDPSASGAGLRRRGHGEPTPAAASGVSSNSSSGGRRRSTGDGGGGGEDDPQPATAAAATDPRVATAPTAPTTTTSSAAAPTSTASGTMPTAPPSGSVAVHVKQGEVTRCGYFPPSATLATVARTMFPTEAAAGNRIRVIFGGAIRPLTATLTELYSGRTPITPVVLHAVVDTGSGGGGRHSDATAASIGAGAATTGTGGSGSGGAPGTSTTSSSGGSVVWGVRLHPCNVLLAVLGVALALLWMLVSRHRTLLSAGGTVLLVVLTAVYATAVRSQCKLPAALHRTAQVRAAAMAAAPPPMNAHPSPSLFNTGGGGGEERRSW